MSTPAFDSGTFITKEHIRFLFTEGYLALPSFVPEEELPLLKEIYDDLFLRRVGRESGDQFDLGGTDEEGKEAVLPQILGPSKYAPRLRETQMFQRMLAIARELSGPEVEFAFDHAINKPPRSGAETPWHQDEAYWNPAFEYPAKLNIWVPLQPATKQNGCMHFIPQSHFLEVIPHQPIGNNPKVHGLEVVPGLIDTSRMVACELPAGGATIHLSRTLHYTPGNQTDDFRRAYIAGFHRGSQPRLTPREFPWIAQRKTAREERAAKAKS